MTGRQAWVSRSASATVTWPVLVRIACTRSSMALMFRQDSAAGSAAAWITFRWMPLPKKSRGGPSTITLTGRDWAYR